MSDIEITQKVTGSLTYIIDWANRLATAYPGQSITVSSGAVVIAPAVASSVSGTGTAVTFHLATAAVTGFPVKLYGTITATLSNGDVDPLTFMVQVVASV